jgi:hypothetical protein
MVKIWKHAANSHHLDVLSTGGNTYFRKFAKRLKLYKLFTSLTVFVAS